MEYNKKEIMEEGFCYADTDSIHVGKAEQNPEERS